MRVARILLVEDNPIMCKFVCSALEADDIRVTEAHAGAQALGLWAAEPTDLVLQDVMLPDMDGFEFVSRLRHLPGGADVPILALCGLLSDLDEARVSAVGFNDLIVKPLEASQLRQAVRAHLPQRDTSPARFGDGRRVLVVDDDPIQAKLVGFRLTRLGFEVSTAADGSHALRLARSSPPDAIVSDIMMPVLDGFGLCAALREDPALAQMPLVLMTNSYVDEEDRKLARAAGADEFVIRTPTMQEVVEALRSSLARARSERAPPATASANGLEKEWTHRVLNQLERQVSLNTSMARRCSVLSAEVAVLSGISDALAGDRDIETALVDVLGACVDAGGFSLGALYLTAHLPKSLLRFGAWDGWSESEVRGLLERAERTSEIFEQRPLSSVVVVPVRRGRSSFGILLMGSGVNALHPEDRLSFLEGVATQIAQALALTRAFAEKDASERRASQQATVLRSVVETVAEGVVVTDARGEFLHWNPAAEAILGTGSVRVPIRQWPERLGLCFGDTLTPVKAEQVPLVRALCGETVDEPGAFLLHRGAGESGRHVTISARPLKERDVIVGAVAVLRDVTEEKATQTRLLVADRLASIGMLAAGVAHEINNPLAAVIGNLELASQSVSSLSERLHAKPMPSQTAKGREEGAERELEELARVLQEMLKDGAEAAERVRRIVHDLRALARSEGDTSSAVDVHAVLESVLRMAHNEIRHRARVTRDYGDVPLVQGNESRLSQVFLNLVINAAQALPDGHADENEIRIATRTDDAGRVVVTVTDTGEGISPETMRQLFVPFFTTKRVGMGTGLGLSICQRLVTAAGGEISVDSRPGQGSTFQVALPRMNSAPVAATLVAAPAVTPAPSRRGRVLLVDDEAVILNVLDRALGRQHDCTLANTAGEALSRVQAGERFDVILCDLMMPVMNGMDLYAEIERSCPDQALKVVFLTGGAFTPALQAFLASVHNERIEKPFDVSALQATINARLQ
jgi:CheY-like chemotaxis protein/PAS domain-containing protein